MSRHTYAILRKASFKNQKLAVPGEWSMYKAAAGCTGVTWWILVVPAWHLCHLERGVSESLGRLSRPADQLTGFKPLSKSKERQGWQGDSQADCDALGEASYVPSQRLPRSCTAPSELCFLHNLKLAHCFCKTPNSTALHPTSTGRSKIHFQVQLGKHPYYPYWWVFRVY